jgi:hypothetical protein
MRMYVSKMSKNRCSVKITASLTSQFGLLFVNLQSGWSSRIGSFLSAVKVPPSQSIAADGSRPMGGSIYKNQNRKY